MHCSVLADVLASSTWRHCLMFRPLFAALKGDLSNKTLPVYGSCCRQSAWIRDDLKSCVEVAVIVLLIHFVSSIIVNP